MTAVGFTIRLPNCSNCGQQVYDAEPGDVHLHLGGPKGDSYSWICSACQAWQEHEIHGYYLDKLRSVGVMETNPADRMRDDLANDDDVADEIENWPESS